MLRARALFAAQCGRHSDARSHAARAMLMSGSSEEPARGSFIERLPCGSRLFTERMGGTGRSAEYGGV
jgi:hypothetical protein